VSPPTTPDQEGQGTGTAFPESPSGVEEQAHNAMTPKAGRWTKREDDLLRSAVDEYGTEVSNKCTIFLFLLQLYCACVVERTG